MIEVVQEQRTCRNVGGHMMRRILFVVSAYLRCRVKFGEGWCANDRVARKEAMSLVCVCDGDGEAVLDQSGGEVPG